MSAQSQLRYPALSDSTRDRWHAVLTSGRPLSDRARRLMAMAIEAVECTGPAGLQTRWHGQCLWIRCEQTRLAELLECSDRTIRRDLDELEALGVLRTVRTVQDSPAGPKELIAYAISLERLEALPERQPTPELDLVICDHPDPFGVESEDPVESTEIAVSGAMSTGLSGGVSGGLSGAMSTGLSGGLSALMNHEFMNHDHERMNEKKGFEDFESQKSQPAKQAQTTLADTPGQCETQIRFCEILAKHILAVAGQQIQCRDGTYAKAPPAQRLKILDAYLADAIAVGRATEADRRDLLALFHHTANRKVTSKGPWLFRCWENRHVPGKSMDDLLTASDRNYAKQVISEVLR